MSTVARSLTQTHDASRIASRRARGFTLIELLVVLTILALSGAAIMLTLPDEGARLRQDSQRLAAYMGHARDEAILTLRTLEVVASPHGYEVRIEDHGHWQPLTDKPFRARAWEDGVRPQMPRGQAQVSVRFDPTGMAEPRTLQLAMGTRKARVQVAADGQVSVDASAH